MFQNIVICYGEAAIEVKTMAEGILAVTVFCMFGIGFYIANKADQFLGEIQENAEDIYAEAQQINEERAAKDAEEYTDVEDVEEAEETAEEASEENEAK